MKNLITLCFLLSFSFLVNAQNTSYSSRTNFSSSCSSCFELTEDFNAYAVNQHINSLFNGLAVFQGTAPTAFGGGWRYHCASNEIMSRALIPEPRFQGNSLIVNFSEPVFGVGAAVYDDHDGFPLVNTISLTLITSLGDSIISSENCNDIGEAGFLGGSSEDGIVSAIWSIDNTNGNLEIDNFTVLSEREYTEEAPVAKKKEKPEVTLFPNPASQKLTLNTSKSKISRIEIYNKSGVMVLVFENIKAKETEIDISSLLKNTYTARIYFKKKCLKPESRNFIKN